MDFASDIDPGPDLLQGAFGRSLDRPSGALALAGKSLLAEACCSDLLCRGVSPRSLMFRDLLQGTAHVLPALPVREDCWYISAGVGSATPLRSCLVTGSHLVPPVCRGLVLWESRMMSGLLLWTVIVCSRAFRARWWWCIMPSGTGLPDTEQAGVASVTEEPIPGIFRGFDLTLQLASLYDLDSGIPDVTGLRAIQPDAAVVKVMSILDNRYIRVVIPDNNVGTDGFHEVLIHDMADADSPYVPLSDLRCLRLDWPKAIFSYMGHYQVDLEHLRHECCEHFSNIQSGLCTHCGKYIHGDLGRHVANFHLDLVSSGGARWPGALYGGARHRIVLTICTGLIPYRLRLRQPIWHDGSLLGRFPRSVGAPSYVHPSPG